jgi:membrane fusion protein (multidrug efflux system)
MTSQSIREIALLMLLASGLACSGSAGQGAAGGGTATAEEAEDPQAGDELAVRVAAVRREPISSLYATSATLRADKRAVVTARAAGVVEALLVEEGDFVRRDQPLARLENAEQQIEFDRTTTVLDTRQREYDRARELHRQGLTSDEEYETIRRQTEEARQSAAMAELMLSRTIIRAPFEGRILTRYVDVGATVANGTAVYDIADLNPLYADVNVPERHIAQLEPGQAVRLIADAASVTADAEIERIAPAVDPASGTVKVTLAVAGNAGLRPGAFVRVEIVTDTHERAVVVPRSALVAEGRRWHLFRVDAAGAEVEKVEVVRGYEEQERVEILEATADASALVPGERVVVVGASALTDGARIRIMQDGAVAEEGLTTEPGAAGDPS